MTYIPYPTPAMTNAAFYFEEDAYHIGGAQIVGRQAAGNGFLRGFARHADVDAFWGYSPSQEGAAAFTRFVRPLRPDRPVHEITPLTAPRLAEVGCLFYPGPDLASLAWRREFLGQASFSLCGVNHTISTRRVMNAVAELLHAPLEPWDALVCTSTASRDVITRLLGAQAEWLGARFGVREPRMPQLPVIPLGVDCDTYVFTADDRDRARQTLGIGVDDVVVLYLGRLSLRAKAHPFAMYRALALASAGRRVVLIECGRFAHDRAAAAFAEGRTVLCPDIGYRRVDGLDDAARRNAWAAADVFCSLSDNIQETFGLTPIEAMAAGLPAVVSDWDGYRDTVRDGVDGFRIPTLMPMVGAGVGLAYRHEIEIDEYNQYVGLVGQFTAVDIDATARAFRTLFDDAGLRRKIGAAGRQRAREVFDWQNVVAAYRSLWSVLAQERARHAKDAPRRWAARRDPFAVFGSFASAQLGADDLISRGSLDPREVARIRALGLFAFASHALPPDEMLERLVARIPADGSIRVRSILAELPQHEQAWIACAVVWLAKIGAVRVSRQPASLSPRPASG